MTTEEYFDEWLKTQKKLFANPIDFAEYYHKAKVEAITDDMIEINKWKYGMLQEGFFEGAKWFKQLLLKQ